MRSDHALAAADLAGEQKRRSTGAAAVILERLAAARGEHGNGGEQVAKLLGAAAVEWAIGAVGQPGDLLEGARGPRLAAFAKDEEIGRASCRERVCQYV